jgi:hypothetical protein
VGTGQYAAAIAKGIFDSVAALAGEVTTQYILLFHPNLSDNSRTFREIVVDVPSLPYVKIRYRKGYYPAAP